MELTTYTTSYGTYRFPTRLYENHIKGIDLLIRALKKKYPFLTGKWSLWTKSSKERPQIDVALPIVIDLDLNKLYEYYDFTAHMYLSEVSNLSVIPDDDEHSEQLKEVDTKIKKYIESNYKNLPDHLRIQGGAKFDWFKPGEDFEDIFSTPYIITYNIIRPTDNVSPQD